MRKRLSFLALLTADFKQRKIAFPLVILSIAFILCLSSKCFADDITRGRLEITEEDASPSIFPYQVKFPNASVTDNADGTASITETDPLSATKALDNLASVAINTSLISDTAATDDLGTEALYWKKLYLGSDISFEGATDDAYQTTLTAVDTTLSDKSINIPNAPGTMAVSATAPATLSALGDIGVTIAKDIVAGVGLSGGEDNVLPGADADTTLTFDATELSNLTYGDSSQATLTISSALSGATDPTLQFGNNMVTLSHDLTVTGGDITLGTTSIFSGGDTASLNNIDAIDATTEATLEAALDIAGDVSSTGMATTVIGANKILESMLKAVDEPADEEFLTYEVTTGDFEWQAGGSGAPTDADYLVGTANGSLSAEIIVGTAPGGELGGTWASPTINDSLAVTSWNLTTPTITTSLTTSTPTTLSAAELDRLDGLTSAIIDDDKIDTYSELNTIVADVTLTHNGLIDTSAEIAGIVGNETGSGVLVFGTSPTFTTDITTPIISLTGGQIAFPATQSASSDVNTLDDYEEGTYTATLTAGTSGTITLLSTADELAYTKIGRMVFVHGSISVDSVSSPVGSLRLNLPFSRADLAESSEATSGSIFISGMTGTVNVIQLQVLATTVAIGEFDGSTAVDDASNHIQANTGLVFSFFYSA